MPIPWLVVLQSVPWTEVIKNAPKVADGAKKLWNSVRGKSSADMSQADGADTATLTGAESIDRLKSRIQTMETAIEDLHDQMLASAELIKTLAEQNTQLVRHIGANSRHLAWLSVITIISGIAALASLYMVIAR